MRTKEVGALLERERELAELSKALANAGHDRGSLVVIAGHAGTGKSALLRAAVDDARRQQLAVGQARGAKFEQELPYGVVRQLFEPLVRWLPEAARKRVLRGAAAHGGLVLSEAPAEPPSAADGGFATLHGLYWLTIGLAAERPTVLVVDDAHWADASSLRALSYLAGRIDELPVALLISMRPHEPTPVAPLLEGLLANPATRRVQPSPLSLDAVARVLGATYSDAGEELCRAFHDATGGNPFYLQELLRAVNARSGLPPVDGVRKAALIDVADRVLARVAALGEGAGELAEAMSVLGTGGRLHHAATVAGQPLNLAAATALAMRRVEILAAEDPLEWIHPLVRRSIYDSLAVTRRDELHRRAAETLGRAGAPPEVIAAHLSALSPTGSTDVVTGLLAAAEDALRWQAPEVAVTLLQRALDEQAPQPPRAALLLKLGQIEVTRRNPAAVGPLEAVRRTSEDPTERALAAIGLAEINTFSGQWEAAARVVREALGEVGEVNAELALELQLTNALICAYDPQLADDFWRDRRRLRSLARGKSWSARALAASLAVTSSLRGQQLDDVIPLCQHATADDVLFAQRAAGGFAGPYVPLALGIVDANAQAMVFAEKLEHAARAQGSFANTLAAVLCRAWVSLRCGDLLEAEELARPTIDVAAEHGVLLLVVNALFLLVDVIAERPAQAALVELAESVELPPAFVKAAGGAWLYSARGRLRALRGARADAEQDLRAGGALCRQLGWGPIPQPWRSDLALALAPEEREHARALVAEELELAGATGLARPRGTVLRAAGLLASGVESIEALQGSVDILADSPARYEHARSLVELGAALRRAGYRGDAREPLRSGLELADRCGAERLVLRAREELLATGARPRRSARSGFPALTASERRVVRLAAEGRSNPEIAQELYVSLKTVETHLSHAYAKLDLSGPGARRRLAKLVSQTAA